MSNLYARMSAGILEFKEALETGALDKVRGIRVHHGSGCVFCDLALPRTAKGYHTGPKRSGSKERYRIKCSLFPAPRGCADL